MTRPNDTSSTARRGRLVYGPLLAAMMGAGALVLTDGSRAAVQESPIEQVRSMQKEFIDLRNQISAEKAKAAETEQFLRDRIALVEQQIQISRESIETTRGETAETADALAKLRDENETLKAATASLDAIIWGVEREALALVKRLPAKLGDTMRPVVQLIPLTEEKAEGLTLYQRFVAVGNVLNAVDKFNTGIHLESENRVGPGGGEVAVTTMYIGVSAAYYANEAGTVGGVGYPTADGFQWIPMAEDAPLILQAIKIAEGGAKAEFLQLPFTVQ